MVRNLICCLMLAGAMLAADLPLIGIASVGFRVSDMERARGFYTGVLGYEEAFQIPGEDGGAAIRFFKINDSQFVEISSDLKPGQDVRMTHIALLSRDVKALRGMLVKQGLSPSPLVKGLDGTLSCYVTDPEDQRIKFVEYLSGSLEMKSRGKALGANRMSAHLMHAGVTVGNMDVSMAFYRDKLGFKETWRGGRNEGEVNWVSMEMPGPHGDYIEYITHFNQPMTRALYGTIHHLGLEVPDIQAAYQISLERRKMADDEKRRPKLGKSADWVFQMGDPDGTRVEPQQRPKPALPYQTRRQGDR